MNVRLMDYSNGERSKGGSRNYSAAYDKLKSAGAALARGDLNSAKSYLKKARDSIKK